MLTAAVEQALAIRGTVMLQTERSDRAWCSVHSAVGGQLEVRVGEPVRRGLSRRGGRAWLRDQGFVQVVDAWARPTEEGAEIPRLLTAALVEALGAAPDARLVTVLAHPGVLWAAGAPAPDAPHVEHLAFALTELLGAGRGKLAMGWGRPEVPRAWAFTTPDGILIEPDLRGDGDAGFTMSGDPRETAEELLRLLHEHHEASAPLFLALMEEDGSGLAAR